MVEVASMEITGTLDSTEIENSLRRIEQKLSGFKAQTESSFGSMTNLGKVASSLSKTLLTIGSAGVAALTGLASVAPAVAPALAKMQIGFMRISHTLGRQLAPLFESVANNLIPAIGSALERFSPQISAFANAAAEGIGALSGALADWDATKLITFSAFALSFAAAGFAIAGPYGAFAGLALGSALGGLTLAGINKIQNQEKLDLSSTISDIAKYNEVAEQTGNPQLNPLVVAGSGVFINFMQDLIEKIYSRTTEKQLAFTSKNSGP